MSRGLFKEVADHVWQQLGPLKGPHVTILGGVHGNESTGIQLVQNLLDSCPAIEKGKLTVAIGNPRAVQIQSRGSEPHADLNRCFSKSLLAHGTDYESNRARVLAPFLESSDVMLDVHSTNKPSLPFIRLAGKIMKRHLDLCSYLPCKILLTDPNFCLANKVALTDEYVGSFGGVGICFESGIASDTSALPVLQRSILEMLSKEFEFFSLQESTALKYSQDEVYEIYEVFRLTEEGFQWGPSRGTKNFEEVKRGQVVGVYGESRPYTVSEDSHIVFPKVPELWKVNKPLGWLARKVKTLDLQ